MALPKRRVSKVRRGTRVSVVERPTPVKVKLLLVRSGAIQTGKININNAPTTMEASYVYGGKKYSFNVVPNRVPKTLLKYLKF